MRTRALIVLLWRARLRISEVLALAGSDLDRSRGAVLLRHGEGGHVETSAWTHGPGNSSHPWLQRRLELPVGALVCIITGRPPDDRGPAPLPHHPAAYPCQGRPP